MAKWVHSSVELVQPIDTDAFIKKIEYACRTCYRSQDKITDGSAEKLIRNCIARGHESVLEHGSITMKVICDRGVSHELVRHRLASYSQESTRYCNYTKDKFGNELQFVYPSWWYDINFDSLSKFDYESKPELFWWDELDEFCQCAEVVYQQMIHDDATPDVARAVLPNCLKTELVMTMNIRELRHFIKLRISKFAHPDIRRIAKLMLKLLCDLGLRIFFEDIIKEYEQDL